jgi:hypothetical protein
MGEAYAGLQGKAIHPEQLTAYETLLRGFRYYEGVSASEHDIMAVQTKPSLVPGQPQKLFSRRPVPSDRSEGFYDSYDVAADGQRFVMLQSDEQQTTSQKLTIIQNWFAEFKEKQK